MRNCFFLTLHENFLIQGTALLDFSIRNESKSSRLRSHSRIRAEKSQSADSNELSWIELKWKVHYK